MTKIAASVVLLALLSSMACSSEGSSATAADAATRDSDSTADAADTAVPDPDIGPDLSQAADAAREDGSTSSGTALAWFSDWRTSTGSDQDALYDGGKWTDQRCTSDVASVVTADGLGFPTANVFRSSYVGAGNCLMVAVEDAWRAPSTGEYLFFRVYHRNDLPDGAVVGHPHPVHIGRGNSYAVVFNFSTPSGGQTGLRLQLPGAEEYPDAFWSYPLTLSQTVRIDLHMHRVSADTAKVEVRVYDDSGELLADNDDFNNGEAPGTPAYRTLTDSDPTIEVDDASFRLLEIGNNDPVGAEEGDEWFVYWGAAAIRVSSDADDWIGSYPAEAEAP